MVWDEDCKILSDTVCIDVTDDAKGLLYDPTLCIIRLLVEDALSSSLQSKME